MKFEYEMRDRNKHMIAKVKYADGLEENSEEKSEIYE